MNTQEQITNSNQQSVELSHEWIQRLREVQTVAVDSSGNELPEIVIATIPHVEESTVPVSTKSQRLEDTGPASSLPTALAIEEDTLPTSLRERKAPALKLPQRREALEDKAEPKLGPEALLKLLGDYIDTNQIKIVENESEVEENNFLPVRPLNSPVPKPLLAPQPVRKSKGRSAKPTNEQVKHSKATRLHVDEEFFLLNHRQTSLRINRLVDRILEKIPPVNATSLTLGDASNLVNTTFVSIQTAVAFARRELGPVLLIDADHQSEFLSRELCSQETTGFMQLISGNLAWQNCVYPTTIPDFDFMPVGRMPELNNSRVATNRNNILRVLSEIKQRYRYVCICAGNLAQFPSLLCSAAADATYLVIDLQSCDQQEVKALTQRLSEAGARTLGCITTEN